MRCSVSCVRISAASRMMARDRSISVSMYSCALLIVCGVTMALRPGRKVTRSSRWSISSASRIGVRESPKRAASATSSRAEPCAMRSDRMSSRSSS
jgi:hypothetical protein